LSFNDTGCLWVCRGPEHWGHLDRDPLHSVRPPQSRYSARWEYPCSMKRNCRWRRTLLSRLR